MTSTHFERRFSLTLSKQANKQTEKKTAGRCAKSRNRPIGSWGGVRSPQNVVLRIH